MKKLLVAVVVACGFAAFANEWYVDPVNGNDAYDGTTSNVVSDTVGPRRTLVGIMELVGNNDTIWLLPGDYAEKTVLAASDSNRRLEIVDKSGLKFRSTAGREKTFIVGQHDGTKGYDGENAIGGVKLSGNSANCVFEGVTFRDCAATTGGGCRDLTQTCWFIGCCFTNCIAATGGAMVQGNASGTEFVNCGGASSTMNSMIGYNVGTMEFCLFLHIDATGRYLFQYGGTFINCTAYGMAPAYSDVNLFYNSLIFGASNNGAYQADLMWVTNSWLGVAKNVNVGENSMTNADERAVRFVSPAMGDFRLTDLSEVTELGDASYLALSPFPAGFVRKDVYGNPVTATSGAIPAGCALEVVHQTGARVDFTKEFEVREFGRTFAAGEYFNIIDEDCSDYTYMIRPVLSAGSTLHNVQGLFGKYYKLSDGKVSWPNITKYFFPLRRKGGWVPVGVRKEPVSTNQFTYTSLKAASIYYADPVNGSDDYDGLSSNVVDAAAKKGPFKTLMGAMATLDANTNTKILYLMPGRYEEGCTTTRPGTGATKTPYGVRYRVYVGTSNLAIIGLEGPEKTFIIGAPHSETQELGPDAIGGVWLKSGTCRCVQDVTITGCYSTDTESTAYTVSGCAFNGGGSETTYCLDCIISNNVAYSAPAKSYGTMTRCKILNNRSSASLCVNGVPPGACLFAGNETATFSATATYGCTFDAKSSGSLGANSYYSLFLNGTGVGSYARETCVDTVPLVADPDTFDYRLGTLSPAVFFGDVSARTEDSTYVLVCDVDGNKLEIKNGKMTVGAVHSGPRVPCVAIVGIGAETVEGGKYGTNLVTSTDPITVTASLKRPFLHFEKDGEQVTPFGQVAYTFSPSDALDAATVVTAVYGTNWYVNASAASDDTLGSSWDTARKTIRSTTVNAVAGDVIHVAAGEYGEAEGSELQQKVQTRVVVPEGVRLQGEGERYAAVIRGAAASEGDEHGYGLGADAVRCVYLGKNATLANFMLTEGRTTAAGNGSAVYAADKTATVVDCLVTNNYCYLGTLYNGRIDKCRIVGNTSIYRAVLGYGCTYYGCFFDHSHSNAKSADGSGRCMNNPLAVDFCTFGPNHTFLADDGSIKNNPTVFAPYSSSQATLIPVRNTVIAGGAVWAASRFYATNCVFTSSYKAFATTNNCLIMTAAAMKLSDDGVPTADSPLNNAGDVALAPDCVNETDINGVPRVLNGGVDAGAFEHDWRVEYKEDLGPRATSVTFASPAVVKTEDGTVRIPSGALEGTFKPGALQLNFTLKGGTLELYLGGELVETFEATDAVELSKEIWPSDENNAFRLAFTPNAADGYAEIARLKKGANGIIFIVR